MKSCKLWVVLLLFLSIWALSDAELKIPRMLNKVLMDVDRDVKKTDAPTTLACIEKCFQRKRCKFFRALKTMFNTMKCSLDLNPGEKSEYPKVNSCREKSDIIIKYPTALAGACSDHRCNATQVCEPVNEGGYRCISDSLTRRQRKRSKGRPGH